MFGLPEDVVKGDGEDADGNTDHFGTLGFLEVDFLILICQIVIGCCRFQMCWIVWIVLMLSCVYVQLCAEL